MLTAYRIADARFPIFDATGALHSGGRWNSVGRGVIYAAETFAGAMLEVLVHANLGIVPRHHRVVRITIPSRVKIETVAQDKLPGWNSSDFTTTRAFGDRWLAESRTAVLLVPSVITEGRENNLLLNPSHPQFGLIRASQPEEIHWDLRLFAPYRKK